MKGIIDNLKAQLERGNEVRLSPDFESSQREIVLVPAAVVNGVMTFGNVNSATPDYITDIESKDNGIVGVGLPVMLTDTHSPASSPYLLTNWAEVVGVLTSLLTARWDHDC